MLTYINIEKIFPHRDNPREDLGDLTELTESIKTKGILQNLTVVPRTQGKKGKEDYTVVIGHRRLAAARQAGLTEVPCIISDMSPLEQIATMLMENIQRNDLSLYEQAQGFQMLLDFGESMNDIAEKTGFSQTTIRRRVKLLELDQEKLRAAALRGGTLLDYADLEQIEDIDLRNSVLEKIGTADFNWALKQAIAKETADKNMVLLIEKMDTFATRIKDPTGRRYVGMYSAGNHNKVEKPANADEVKYYYTVSDYNYVSLYAEAPAKAKEDEAAAARREQFQATKNALAEETQRAYNLRWEFVNEFSNAKAKKHKNVIIEYLLRAMLQEYYSFAYDDFFQILDIEFPEDRGGDEWNFNDIAEKVVKEPERCLLAAAYLSIDSEQNGYFDWNNNHRENEGLDLCYAFLESLGYEMSEKERQLQDGTHELFHVDEE